MTEQIEKARFKLRKLIKQLGAIKGRHTELVSVYVPAGYSLHEMTNQLRQEQSTSENIKSKPVRKNVTTALEKIMRHLQLYKRNPDNGLAIFCGNVSEKEGAESIELFTIEPPEPVKVKMYWCDQRFVLEPLEDMIAEREIYGIMCLDRSEADVGLLVGKRLEPAIHLESIVPGKTRAGGQCLEPSSLVQLSNGEITEIKDVHNPTSVKSAKFDDFTLSDSPIIDKWDVEKDVKYKIITKLPRTKIESSADHTFFVWGGDSIQEKPASELKVGEYLLMPERIEIKGELQALNSIVLYNSYKISDEGRNLLVRKRKEQSLSQKELAKKIGATQTAISLIELDKRDVRLEFLKDICAELGIEFNTFVRKYCTPKSEIQLPETLDERTAQILGYFAGDGSFEKERLSFHEKDEKTIAYYHSLTRDLFNCNTHLKFRENKGFWVLRIHGKPIVRLLNSEFPELKGYANTEIPKKILKSGDSVLASFLRGFFDAEGYVSLGRGIGMGINNEKLAKQIQLALPRFGILASLNEYDNRRNPYTKETRFTISITEKESLSNFSKDIGFSVPYKEEKLASVLNQKSSVSYVRRIVVSGKNIRKVIEENGMRITDFPKVTNFFRNERLMSKNIFLNSILGELRDAALYEKLKPVLDYNLVPVKISKVEKIGTSSEMVDISVKNKNFIANGLLVHNSSARFERVREGLLNDWLKRVGEAANKFFEEHKETLGILLGGPGPIKELFMKEDYLHADVRKKILGTVDTSYTGEYGLNETIERGKDLIKEATVLREKKLLQKFFEALQKPHGLVVYGLQNVVDAVEKGAVDTVIVSERLETIEAEYECACGTRKKFTTHFEKGRQVCETCNQSMRILGEKDIIDAIADLAANYGSKVEVVSADTPEGRQFFELGGIGALLRYGI